MNMNPSYFRSDSAVIRLHSVTPNVSFNRLVMYIVLMLIFTGWIVPAFSQTSTIPPPSLGTTPYSRVIKIRSSSDIWAGYNRLDALALAHYNGSKWNYFYGKRNGSRFERINDIAVTLTGHAWVAASNGLFYIDRTDSTKDKHLTRQSGLLHDSITCIAHAGNKTWIVTPGGLSVYSEGSFTNYAAINYPLLSERKIRIIAATAKGEALMATDKGIIRFRNDQFDLLDTSNSELQSNKISALCTDENNQVWIGTPQLNAKTNLYKYNGGVITAVYTPRCRDLSNGIQKIVTGSNGRVLIITSENNWNSSIALLYNEEEHRLYRQDWYLNLINNWPAPTLSTVGLDNKGNFYYIKRYEDSIIVVPEAEIILKDSMNILANWAVLSKLDANNVSLPVLSRGDFGWGMAYSGVSIEVPKGSCRAPLFAGAIWLGAQVGNDVHFAAQTYRQNGNDFYPGPVNKGYPLFNKTSEAQFERQWKLTRAMIEKFRLDFAAGQTFAIPEPILSWPAHGDTSKGQLPDMAPFIDVNSDGRYNPYHGDYPDIKGDMCVFWVMNDLNNIHSETQAKPLGFEIYGMAYSYACGDIKQGSPDEAMNNTVFLQYRIINRSEWNYTGAKSGIWIDKSYNHHSKDFVGCNPVIGYGFGHHYDSYDELGAGYGASPLATAVIPLGGDSITSALETFITFASDGSLAGHPSRPEHFWNYVNAKFKDGRAVTYGATGRDTNTTPVPYMYPGKNDLANRPEWSEYTAGNIASYRTFVTTAPAFNLAINADTTIHYAILFSKSADTLNYPDPLLSKMDFDVQKVKGWFAANNFPSCDKAVVSGTKKIKANQPSFAVYPNPVAQLLNIRTHSAKPSSLVIYDLSGRELLRFNAVHSDQPLDVSALAPGFYFIRISCDGIVSGSKFIKE